MRLSLKRSLLGVVVFLGLGSLAMADEFAIDPRTRASASRSRTWV